MGSQSLSVCLSLSLSLSLARSLALSLSPPPSLSIAPPLSPSLSPSLSLQPMSIFTVASSWGSATLPTNEYLYSGLILGLCHSSNQCVSLQWPHLGALPLLQPMSIFTVASSWGPATPPTRNAVAKRLGRAP